MSLRPTQCEFLLIKKKISHSAIVVLVHREMSYQSQSHMDPAPSCSTLLLPPTQNRLGPLPPSPPRVWNGGRHETNGLFKIK